MSLSLHSKEKIVYLPRKRYKTNLKKAANLIKDFKFTVLGTTGLLNAQVTSGGIDTKDFDEKTMQSKLNPGLFAAGEVLDVDGDCGGFNLQWAFSSGMLAASSAVEFISGETK